jgi:hypothetical protein
MATPVPMPNTWMKVTPLVPKAKKLTASRAAAMVRIRPVWASMLEDQHHQPEGPMATLSA